MRPASGPPACGDVAEVPDYAPLDPFTRSRIRGQLIDRFGKFSTLDLHLDLLDRRGAWYLERVMGAWPADVSPDGLFAVAHNVVRTQMAGPAPSPDLDAWILADRPSSPLLAAIWEFTDSRIRPTLDDAEVVRNQADTSAAAAEVTSLLARLDDAERDIFLTVYVVLGAAVRERPLPPIGT